MHYTKGKTTKDGKIDKRINYMIVLDTETAPCDKDVEQVAPWNMLVYDIGWAIVDRRGRVYKTRSFVNADVFLDEKTLMQSAYYADKIPKYWNEIKSGERKLLKMFNIRRTLLQDMEEYGVTRVWSHNAHFDVGSLNNTQRWLSKSKYRYFYPYGTELYDTLKISRQLIGTMPTYKEWCIKNGYMTKNNRVRLTAEIIYRFISGNNEFVEEHTGLEDVFIETAILAYCYSKHKKMDGKLY